MTQVQKIDRTLANGPMDRKLLAGAADGLSPRELARLVGDRITPEEAAQRVRGLLDSRNWLTWFEQEQLVLESINELISGMREWANAGSLDHIKVSLAALKMKQDNLQKNRVSPEAAANIIREGQARIMLQAIQVAMMGAADELARRYPQVSHDEVREVFTLALPAAVDQVERRIEQQ